MSDTLVSVLAEITLVVVVGVISVGEIAVIAVVVAVTDVVGLSTEIGVYLISSCAVAGIAAVPRMLIASAETQDFFTLPLLITVLVAVSEEALAAQLGHVVDELPRLGRERCERGIRQRHAVPDADERQRERDLLVLQIGR